MTTWQGIFFGEKYGYNISLTINLVIHDGTTLKILEIDKDVVTLANGSTTSFIYLIINST